MRIAVWHNLPSGGGKRALSDHVRAMIERGHEVESWSPPTADLDYLRFDEAVREHVVPLATRGRTDWDKRLRIPAQIAPLIANMRDHCRQCAAEIEAGSFDVLLANSCAMFATSPIGRYVSLPKAIYLQEPYRFFYEALPRLPWLPPLKAQEPRTALSLLRSFALDRRQLNNARAQASEEIGNAAAFDRILVNSLFSRESILRSYGIDAEVCYLGVDTDRFVDLARPRERLVVGFGAYQAQKNIPLAIRAVSAMAAPRPSLAWIGNAAYGDEIARMQALAQECGVDFVPHVRIPDAAIVDILNRASALIYTPRLEPFGLAPIEAAACGLPCVAVAEGGVRETVIDGQTGLLVQSTPEALALGLEHLLEDPELVRQMGEQARANAVQKWSLSAMGDRIEAALMDVVVRRRPPEPPELREPPRRTRRNAMEPRRRAW
jgi:glycosyltransferase involved in cell wall biosynthesis